MQYFMISALTSHANNYTLLLNVPLFLTQHSRVILENPLDLEERNSVQDEGENPPPNSDACESESEYNRLFERPRELLMRRAGETITDGRRRAAALYGMIHNWPYAARKRTGDSQSGWRPPPDKNI